MICHSPSHFRAGRSEVSGASDGVALDPRRRSGRRKRVDLLVERGEGVDRALARARQVAEHVDHRLQVLVQDGLRLRVSRSARASSERASAAPDWESTRSERRRARLARSAAREAHPHRHRLASRRARRGGPRRGPRPGPASASTAAAGGDALRGRPSRGRRSAQSASAPPRANRRRRRRPPSSRRTLGSCWRGPRGPPPSARRSRPPACRAPAARAGSRPPSPARRARCAISTSAGRRRLARSWLCSPRSCLPTRFTWRSAPRGRAPQEVVPDEAVEVVGGGGAGVDLHVGDLGHGGQVPVHLAARSPGSPPAACPRPGPRAPAARSCCRRGASSRARGRTRPAPGRRRRRRRRAGEEGEAHRGRGR